MKARRLKTIAAWINENRPELRATIEPWTESTDRKIPGTRLRHQGKGRKGYRLHVFLNAPPREGVKPLRPIFSHNSAETYRTNDEVERWLATYLGDCQKGVHTRFWPSSLECSTCGAKLRPEKGTK